MRTRKKYSAQFKAETAMAALKDQETLAEIGKRTQVHPAQVSQWRRQLEKGAASVFEAGADTEMSDREAELLRKIGELTMERDFLSKGLRRSR